MSSERRQAKCWRCLWPLCVTLILASVASSESRPLSVTRKNARLWKDTRAPPRAALSLETETDPRTGTGTGTALGSEDTIRPLNYKDVMETVEGWGANAMYRPFLRVVDAYKLADDWPRSLSCPTFTGDKGEDRAPCVSPIARLTRFLPEDGRGGEVQNGGVNYDGLGTWKPGLLFSGTVHGDERVGAVAVMELAKLLLSAATSGSIPQQKSTNETALVEKPAGDRSSAEVLSEVYTSYLKWLLTKRDFWILPFANAWGYAENKREENGIDVNRDFPYLNTQCFRSNAARIIDRVLHLRVFSAGVTFHGGMRSLTYGWGSPNHLTLADPVPEGAIESVSDGVSNSVSNGVSDRVVGGGRRSVSAECPDHEAQRQTALAMQEAAGTFDPLESSHLRARDATQFPRKTQEPGTAPGTGIGIGTGTGKEIGTGLAASAKEYYYLPVAQTNDLVYPVRGGLEDWAYAGGWEGAPSPIGPCPASLALRSNGSRSLDPLSEDPPFEDPHLKMPFFLTEVDDSKAPEIFAYGRSSDILAANAETARRAGHVPRLVRSMLRLAELVEPEPLFVVVSAASLLPRIEKAALSRPLSLAKPDLTDQGLSLSSSNADDTIWIWNDTKRLLPILEEALGASNLRAEAEASARASHTVERGGKGEVENKSGAGDSHVAEEAESFLVIFPMGCVHMNAFTARQGHRLLGTYRGSFPCINLFASPPFLLQAILVPVLAYRGNDLVDDFDRKFSVAALFDQDWLKQRRPEPRRPPVSHLALARASPLARETARKFRSKAPISVVEKEGAEPEAMDDLTRLGEVSESVQPYRYVPHQEQASQWPVRQ